MDKQIAERIFVESGLSNIQEKIDKYDIGTITAFRKKYTRAQNRERNKQILAYFMTKMYSVTKVKGSFIEDQGGDNPKELGEESFFIADQNGNGRLLAELKKLGTHFEQHSILFKTVGDKPKLYGLSDEPDANPKKGEVVALGPANMGAANGAMFSRVKVKQFAFESIDEVLYPDSNMGKYGLYLAAKAIGIK